MPLASWPVLVWRRQLRLRQICQHQPRSIQLWGWFRGDSWRHRAIRWPLTVSAVWLRWSNLYWFSLLLCALQFCWLQTWPSHFSCNHFGMQKLHRSPQSTVSLRHHALEQLRFKYQGRQSQPCKDQLHLYQALTPFLGGCQRCLLCNQQGLGRFLQFRRQSAHRVRQLIEEDHRGDLRFSREEGFALTLGAHWCSQGLSSRCFDSSKYQPWLVSCWLEASRGLLLTCKLECLLQESSRSPSSLLHSSRLHRAWASCSDRFRLAR